MMVFGLLLAALFLWALFRWRQKHRWSPRGRKNKPLRRFSIRLF